MEPRLTGWILPSALIAGFVLLACTASWSPAVRTPRQGWLEVRGPVVPHDGFPADCSLCHEGDDWHTIRQDFLFDHELETGVPLVGAHATAECLRCHNDRGPVGAFARRGCAGCHEDVHRGALGADCSSCHGESDWRPEGQVALHASTRLPLVGAHASVACWACHEGASVGSFRNVDPACAGCHMDDYDATTDPDHAAAGYPTTCQDCHGFAAFDEAAIFSHGGITSGCAACHLDDYQRARDPDHAGQGFPLSCEDCHSSFTTWSGAAFTHAGISSGCVNCHLDDYQATEDPRHGSAGFAQDCESCHTSTTTWQGARYAAHAFPITSGAHKNRACSQCHLTNTNYDAFSCTHCHEHRQSSMDSKHNGENGYVWQSNACYGCHPDGRK
jgi:hypothetical protein